MNTRCTISLQTKTGKIKSVYCHSEGYPEYMLPILNHCFNTYDKIEKLLSYGDLSQLGEKLNPDPHVPHKLKQRQPNVCVFYHRDNEEDYNDVKAKTFASEQEMLDKYAQSYNYIFKNKTWHIL